MRLLARTTKRLRPAARGRSHRALVLVHGRSCARGVLAAAAAAAVVVRHWLIVMGLAAVARGRV